MAEAGALSVKQRHSWALQRPGVAGWPAPRLLCPPPRINQSPDSGPGPGSPEPCAHERVFVLAALLPGEALSLT